MINLPNDSTIHPKAPPLHSKRGSSSGKKGIVPEQLTRKAPPTGRAGNSTKKHPTGRRATPAVSAASRKTKPAVSSAEAAPVTSATTAQTSQVEEIAIEAREAPSRVPLLSVADRVVAEYEMLLDAVPTLARQMGRLQEDTETMAKGLETRVRNLVEGYRELNGLVEQAPLIVSNANSEYAQPLSGRSSSVPPSVTANDHDHWEKEQASDVERIHAELFSLREAKITLDNAVKLTPDFCSSDKAKWAGGMRRSVPVTSWGLEKERSGLGREIYPSPSSAVWKNPGRLKANSTRTTRPNDRRALVEVELDPDLPLPLPVFPGYGRLLGDGHRSDRKSLPVPRNTNIPDRGSSHAVPAGATVIPRQRQSHCLPPELRGISTTPKLVPRVLPRARPKVEKGSRLASSSRSQKYGGSPAAPGSEAAASVARENRRQTILAVEELRKEMREREEKLEKELEKMKAVRLRRAARRDVGGGFRGPLANKRRSLPTAKRGRRGSNVVVSSKRFLGSKKTAATRAPEHNGPRTEGADKKGDSCNSRAEASGVEKVDVEAQTAADGVQVFLPLRPTVQASLSHEVLEKRDHVVETPGVSSKAVGRGDDSFSTSSSLSLLVGEKNHHVFPPPSVVYLEGEGRNASWKPCDDDRLLTSRGICSSQRAAALSRRPNDARISPRRDSEGEDDVYDSRGVSAAIADDDRGGVMSDGSFKIEFQRKEELVVTTGMPLGAVTESPGDLERNVGDRWANLEGMLALSATDDAADARARGERETCAKGERQDVSPSEEGRETSEGGERQDVSPLEEGREISQERRREDVYPQEEGRDASQGGEMQDMYPQEEGRETPQEGERQDVYLQEEGRETSEGGERQDVYLQEEGRETSQEGERQDVYPQEEGRETSQEGERQDVYPQEEGRKTYSRKEAETVTPVLIGLMREVVEQQRGLGEERSALMQALRAEVEGRRILLAQQEVSLRHRELALEKRESEVSTRQREATDDESRSAIVQGDERDRNGQVDEGVPKRSDGYCRNGTCREQKEVEGGEEGSMSGSPDNTVEEGEDVCREDDSNDEESSIGQRSQPSQVEIKRAERCDQYLTIPVSSSSVDTREREGKLHLSLATAVLSVARKICDMDERTTVRLEGAQGVARRAIEEARKEGEDARRRQSEVIQRLEDMEQGSRERAGFVERELSKLRVEGRLNIEKTQARQAILHRQCACETNVSAPNGNSSVSSIMSGLDDISELEISSSRGLLLPVPASPLFSVSRSSISEGQVRGSFSDGEMVRLTPDRRNAIEEGQILPHPASSPRHLQAHLTAPNYPRTSNIPGLELRRIGDPKEPVELLMTSNSGFERGHHKAAAESLSVASGWASSAGFGEDDGPGETDANDEVMTGGGFPLLSKGGGDREPGQVDSPSGLVDKARDEAVETETHDAGSCGAASTSISSSSIGAEGGFGFPSAFVLEASLRGERGIDCVP